MKPVPTDRTNVVLTGPENDPEVADLPAERIKIYPPDVDPADAGDVEPEAGIETVWMPDAGERRALANGAPVHLRVWGTAHPPVNLLVGDPIELHSLIEKAHVDRAVGYWFASIAEKWNAEGQQPNAQDVLDLWHRALEETAEMDTAQIHLPGDDHRNGDAPADA